MVWVLLQPQLCSTTTTVPPYPFGRAGIQRYCSIKVPRAPLQGFTVGTHGKRPPAKRTHQDNDDN